MTDQKPTTVDTRKPVGDVSNPRNIVWPFDKHGFTTMLRKEGARAVGRIKGDPAKLEVFLDTLRVLGAHAHAKIADQQEDKELKLLAIENRRKAEYARSLEDQKAEVARLKNLLASAEKALKAKQDMPEGTNSEGK